MLSHEASIKKEKVFLSEFEIAPSERLRTSLNFKVWLHLMIGLSDSFESNKAST